MEQLLEAIKNKDIVKTKKIFTEQMKTKVEKLRESEKNRIASEVRIEEETEIVVEGKSDDDDDEDDEKDGKEKSGKDTKDTEDK